MIVYIHVGKDGIVNGWGGHRSMDTEIEVEIPDNHELLNMAPRLFRYKNGVIEKDNSIVLGKEKERKNKELNDACNKAITDGFLHNINGIDYWFSFDAEAQSNFQGTRPILKEGLIPSINWTVRIGGKDGEYTRIPIDATLMDELTIAILQHKDSNISKYRETLLPRVDAAVTVDEINTIVW
jgi:hypothetical protein